MPGKGERGRIGERGIGERGIGERGIGERGIGCGGIAERGSALWDGWYVVFTECLGGGERERGACRKLWKLFGKDMYLHFNSLFPHYSRLQTSIGRPRGSLPT